MNDTVTLRVHERARYVTLSKVEQRLLTRRSTNARFPHVRKADMVAALSGALDLAEGHDIGHAQRVAYIALSVARHLGLGDEERRTAFYAALLHDAGVASASAELHPHATTDEFELFAALPSMRMVNDLMTPGPRFSGLQQAIQMHVEAGAELVKHLSLDDGIAEAVLYHHAWWNGYGFPAGAAGEGIPLAARLVAFADLAERVLQEETNPLAARYVGIERIEALSGQVLDPSITAAFGDLSRDDRFWIELSSPNLANVLAAQIPDEPTRLSEGRVMSFAEAFTHIIDSKSGFNRSHSRRVGELAEALALAAGMDAERAWEVRLAALLHDIGHLGVPNRVMAKPDIFTVEEMDLMREHPRYSRAVLGAIPGMANIARWTEAHHEWVDGRGYPDRLAGDQIPAESRIIAIADSFDALTSPRPHRGAMPPAEALLVMANAAGSQFDPQFFAAFVGLMEIEEAAGV